MTPADHGYVRCDACRAWRRPEALASSGTCADAAESCRRLLYERLSQLTPDSASWVPRALDWHTDACLTRQATGEGCNCRPWTEGAP